MEKTKVTKKKLFTNICVSSLFILIFIFVFYGFKKGIFSSTKAFEDYIAGFGIWEAVIFIGIQIIQVILPFMPSSLGLIVGSILFGPALGFLYNYLAICTGSCIDFLLSKKYGTELVKKLVSKKKIDKYINSSSSQKQFNKLFSIAIFVPGAPDDYLCYIAGLTKMKFKYFLIVILLGKPLSIAIFSIGTNAIFNFIKSFL
ncbi:MAG: TVP38/TMEM64 family protein [Pleomorphochaeta sp.]